MQVTNRSNRYNAALSMELPDAEITSKYRDHRICFNASIGIRQLENTQLRHRDMHTIYNH